jgi:hypothetical protein
MCRWEDNIKIDLRETGWGGTDWFDLAQNRDQWRVVVNAVMVVIERWCLLLLDVRMDV